MERAEHLIVTKREAMSLLGITKTALARLERSAKIPNVPGRYGYTTAELKRLLARLKRILRQQA